MRRTAPALVGELRRFAENKPITEPCNEACAIRFNAAINQLMPFSGQRDDKAPLLRDTCYL